jgi:hypothetical protein
VEGGWNSIITGRFLYRKILDFYRKKCLPAVLVFFWLLTGVTVFDWAADFSGDLLARAEPLKGDFEALGAGGFELDLTALAGEAYGLVKKKFGVGRNGKGSMRL